LILAYLPRKIHFFFLIAIASLFLLLKEHLHRPLLLDIGPSLFLQLRFPECLIRNDGRMGIGNQVPDHAAIIFDLRVAHTDGCIYRTKNPTCTEIQLRAAGPSAPPRFCCPGVPMQE
jgi:hypothetical protein